MVRFPCAWTVHDATPPKLATTQLCYPRRARYQSVPSCPTGTSDTHAYPPHRLPIGASPRYQGPASAKTIPEIRQNLRHSFVRLSPEDPIPKQNPLKTWPHSGFSSLHGFLTFAANRLYLACSAIARRETEETFFSHKPKLASRIY